MDSIDIAVDGQGFVHIVGSDGSTVHYATNQGGHWQEVELAYAPQGGAAFWPVVAASPAGTVAIAYSAWSRWFFCDDVCEPEFDNVFEDVYYLTGDGTSWSKPSPFPGTGEQADLSFSGEDLYATKTGDEIATWSVLHDGAWSPPEEIKEMGLAALVIDRQGRPNLLLRPVGELVLRTYSNGGTFVDDKVPGVSGAEHPLLVFDSTNRPQIVYSHYDPLIDDDRVMTTLRDAATWTTPTELPVRAAHDVALDSADKLHVVFAKEDPTFRWWDFRYALIDDVSTSRVRLDRSNFYDLGRNGMIAMALDAADQPHVVYTSQGIDGEDGTLYTVGTVRP